MRLPSLALACAALLAACGGSRVPGNQPVVPPAVDGQSKVRFIAIGDAGTGSANQFAVGSAMQQVCVARGCDLVVELGDNFYVSGVGSATDAQWEDKFEKPYAPLSVPFFAVLGNHDNSRGPGEGSDNARGDFQVDYHYRADRTSSKWQMPSRYYTFTAPLGSEAPLVEFFALDSNPLAAIVADPNPLWLYATYSTAQLQWLQERAQASKARWKIGMSHHPYLSNGLHGNAGNADGIPGTVPGTANAKPWKDFVEAGVCAQKFDLFLQGHDHDLEWIEPVPACGKTQFVVSGAADTPRAFGDAARNKTWYQKDLTLGFFWFEISGSRLTGAVYQLDAAGVPQLAFEKSMEQLP